MLNVVIFSGHISDITNVSFKEQQLVAALKFNTNE